MSKTRTAALSTSRLVLDASVTKQQLTDYANAVLRVNNYAYAITQQQLPVLSKPPKNYADFATSFTPAKQHALDWTGTILPMMLALPEAITNMDTLFSFDDNLADGYLAVLIADPTNKKAQAGLQLALTGMKTMVDGEIATVTNIQTQLNAFDLNIVTDAAKLSAIATQALEAAGADKQTIAELNQKIVDLNGHIDSLNKWLTVAEIGIVLALIVVGIGVIVCLALPGSQVVGGGIIALGVVGISGAIAGTVILNKLIVADQAAIMNSQNAISDYNKDIILLQGINSQFEQLVKANALAHEALATVLGIWTNLGGVIGTVKADLATVAHDLTSADYSRARNDLAAADVAWKEVVKFATALNGLTLQWTDANGKLHDCATSSVQADMGQMNMVSRAA